MASKERAEFPHKIINTALASETIADNYLKPENHERLAKDEVYPIASLQHATAKKQLVTNYIDVYVGVDRLEAQKDSTQVVYVNQDVGIKTFRYIRTMIDMHLPKKDAKELKKTLGYTVSVTREINNKDQVELIEFLKKLTEKVAKPAIKQQLLAVNITETYLTNLVNKFANLKDANKKQEGEKLLPQAQTTASIKALNKIYQFYHGLYKLIVNEYPEDIEFQNQFNYKLIISNMDKTGNRKNNDDLSEEE